MLSKDKQTPLNILHLNTYDTYGGATRAAHRLHEGLLCLGYDSTMYVATRRSIDPTISALIPPAGLIYSLIRLLRRVMIKSSFIRYQRNRPDGYEIFSDDRSQFGPLHLPQSPASDIINLHWIARFIDYGFFFKRVTEQTPVVWTLHDMNAFTGGCHYDNGCENYKNKCGSCPQLGSTRISDLSYQIWRRKHAIFRQIKPNRLHIVATNKWMAAEAKNSRLLREFPVTIIPYGLDTSVFSPIDRQTARDALDIPEDARVVLFVADSTTNHRKGFTLLAQALQGIKNINNLFLLSIGGGEPVVGNQIPHIHLGHIDNNRLLALVYSAADLFVIPSLQDNFPNTILESMACGTPIIGFDVGGIPDMILNGVTGMLIPQRDINELRNAIVKLLEDPIKLAKMAADCRHLALKEYSLKTQARRYAKLYKQIIDDLNR
jgi:glycosyltransferase involved in cell wall biosynthesis